MSSTNIALYDLDNARATSALSRIKASLLYEPPVGKNPPFYLFFRNRYFRVCVLLLMCVCNTLVFLGWQHFSKMLYRSGAYRWNCSEGSLQSLDDSCLEQRNSVKALYQIGLCSESVGGVLAGISLDYAGAWLTGAVGCLSYFIGWMFLGYSSQSSPLYIPGMILFAGSTNFISFPSLTLADYFPGHSGMIMSLAVAAQCAGTAVAPIMMFVWDAYPSFSFRRVIWGHLSVAFFPIAAFYFLCIPWKFPPISKCDPDGEPDVSVDSVLSTDAPENSIRKEPTQENGFEELLKVDKSAGEEKKLTTLAQAETSSSLPLYKQIFSPEYMLFTLYFVLQSLQFNYYPTTVDDQFGSQISNFQGYLLPAQVVFGALFGFVVDQITTLPICILLVLMVSIAYVTALIPNTPLQYFTSVLYVISYSYIYTVKCTYIAECFPPTYFGSLIGIIGFVSGILGLINIPIQNADSYVVTCIAYIIVGVVAFVIISILMYRKRKGFSYRREKVHQHTAIKGTESASNLELQKCDSTEMKSAVGQRERTTDTKVMSEDLAEII